MTVKIVETDAGKVAVVHSDRVLLSDGQSALEWAMNIFYTHESRKIAINKEAICEDFFKLSTGVAGEIAQKFANYRYHVCIFGDFSGYTSKPLQDYMYESNRGKHIGFAADEDEAIRNLSR